MHEIEYKNLKSTLMKHGYGEKYIARNLSHSFTTVILDKLGIPARARDFRFSPSVPEKNDSWGTGSS